MNRRNIFRALLAALPLGTGAAAVAVKSSSGFAMGGAIRNPMQTGNIPARLTSTLILQRPEHNFDDEIMFRYGEDGLTRMKLLGDIERIDLATEKIREAFGDYVIDPKTGQRIDPVAFAMLAVGAVEDAEFTIIK